MQGSTSTISPVSLPLEEEMQLVEAAKKDPDAFAPLYDHYYIPVFRFIYRRTPSEDTAADVTAQTFLKAFKSIGNYKIKGIPFGAWLFRIARNEVNLYYRREKRARVVYIEKDHVEELFSDFESGNPMISEEVANDANKVGAALKQALSELKEDELNLVELRYFEGRSYKEIASIMDLSITNAKVRNHRILKKIEKLIKNKYHG